MADREELKYLASRWELEDSILSDRKVGRGYCPFAEPYPHKVTELAGGCHV